MAGRTLLIEHDGATYHGHTAVIRKTSLGYEDHGILTAWLHCEWPGSGIGVGGYCLDRPRDVDARDYTRVGTAYGLDHLIRLMEVVGVSTWETLSGAKVIVLFEGEGFAGSRAVGLANLLDESKVLILKAHAEAWHDEVVA